MARPKGSKHGLWKGFGQVSGHYISTIRWRSKAQNREFDITAQYLWELFVAQDGKCAVSGRAITLDDNQTASVDRIDSSLGYVRGNVRWIHKDFQDLLMARGLTATLKMCRELLANHDKTAVEAT